MSRTRRRAFVVTGLAVGVVGLGTVSLRDGRSEPAPVDPPVQVRAPEGRVRVEVLNVGGVTGMARDATGLLRDIGFDVVDFGNARSFDASRPTTVVDRVGRPDLAQAVADALGIDNVLSEPNPNLYLDVSVLLGSEWSRPGPGRDGEGRGRRAWWDPRAWLSR